MCDVKVSCLSATCLIKFMINTYILVSYGRNITAAPTFITQIGKEKTNFIKLHNYGVFNVMNDKMPKDLSNFLWQTPIYLEI